jgi:hypothetical protein
VVNKKDYFVFISFGKKTYKLYWLLVQRHTFFVLFYSAISPSSSPSSDFMDVFKSDDDVPGASDAGKDDVNDVSCGLFAMGTVNGCGCGGGAPNNGNAPKALLLPVLDEIVLDPKSAVVPNGTLLLPVLLLILVPNVPNGTADGVVSGWDGVGNLKPDPADPKLNTGAVAELSGGLMSRKEGDGWAFTAPNDDAAGVVVVDVVGAVDASTFVV